MARISEKLSPVTVNVPIVTAWQAYADPVIGIGTGTVNYYQRLWRRVGDTVEIDYIFNTLTAGTSTDFVGIPLPSGILMDTTRVISDSNSGYYQLHTGGNYSFGGVARRLTSLGATHFGLTRSGTALSMTGANLTHPTSIYVRAVFPVANWTTHGPVSTVAYAAVHGGQALGTPLILGATDGQGTRIIAGPGIDIPVGYVGETQIKTTNTDTGNSTGANTYNSVALLSITLTPGVYLLTYNAFVHALTGSGNLDIFNATAGTQVPGSQAYFSTGTGNASRMVPVTVTTTSTFNVRVRGSVNNDSFVRGFSLTAGLTDPDNASTFMSVRLA